LVALVRAGTTFCNGQLAERTDRMNPLQAAVADLAHDDASLRSPRLSTLRRRTTGRTGQGKRGLTVAPITLRP
jgi:hypothetical protein